METEKLAMCRICLVENVRMYVVVDKNLQQLYEKLTDVPFVTEDRPMLACFFCCAKIKQCTRFQRKCLEAEERFNKMLSEDCKPNSSNHGYLEYYGGFTKTSTAQISIDYECEIECNAIKVEIPALCERQDEIIEQEEQQSDELEQKYINNSYQDVKDIQLYRTGGDSQDPLFEVKIEIEEQKISMNTWRATQMNSAPAKNPKLEVQKDIKDNSISPKHKKQGQEKHAKIKKTEKNEKTSLFNSFRKTEKAIKDIHKIDIKPKLAIINNTKCNNEDMKKENCANKDEFKCKICNYNGINSRDIKKHSIRHNKPYKCDICQKCFGYKQVLDKHIHTHTGKKPFKCDVCPSSFIQKVQLQTHILTHTGETPYKCDICQRSFNSKYHMNTHIRSHTGKKPYKCDICQKSFNRIDNLNTHIRTHTGEKPYLCDSCPRRFKLKCDLNRHIRTHTGEKPFKCDICQARFRFKHHMNNHVRLHTGTKPFNSESSLKDICGITDIDRPR